MHMQHFLKTLLIFAAFIALGSTSLHADAGAEIKDAEFAAKVNGVGISSKDFDRSVDAAEKQFAGIGKQPGMNSPVNVKKEVMNRLIDFELMLQDAKKRGIVVDEARVDSNLDSFKSQFTEENTFSSFLEQNGLTEEEMKEQFRRRETIQELQKVLMSELMAQITLSDEKTKAFYDKNIENFKRPEQVKASHILISVAQDADDAAKKEARGKIEEVQKKVQSGEDFAELARANSSCPSNAQGGDLGFFGKGQMVKPFEDATFALKPGETSDIVETQFGYHLIKMTEKKEAGTVPYEEVQERISQYLSQVELDQAQQDYIKGLRDKAEIATLVKLD